MTNNVKQEDLRKEIIQIVNDMTPDYDDELLSLINQQVIQALKELKGNGRMMSDVTYDFGTAMVVAEHEVVTVSDIDELIKEYKGE